MVSEPVTMPDLGLTIFNNWGSLVALGIKPIDVRQRKTKFVGHWFFIHIGAKLHKVQPRVEVDPLPLGHVVAVARLADVINYPTRASFEADHHRHHNPPEWHSPRLKGWYFDPIHRIKPAPARGFPGIWLAISNPGLQLRVAEQNPQLFGQPQP